MINGRNYFRHSSRNYSRTSNKRRYVRWPVFRWLNVSSGLLCGPFRSNVPYFYRCASPRRYCWGGRCRLLRISHTGGVFGGFGFALSLLISSAFLGPWPFWTFRLAPFLAVQRTIPCRQYNISVILLQVNKKTPEWGALALRLLFLGIGIADRFD